MNFGFRAFEDMQGEPLGSFGANTGQALKLLDQASKGACVNRESSSNSVPEFDHSDWWHNGAIDWPNFDRSNIRSPPKSLTSGGL